MGSGKVKEMKTLLAVVTAILMISCSSGGSSDRSLERSVDRISDFSSARPYDHLSHPLTDHPEDQLCNKFVEAIKADDTEAVRRTLAAMDAAEGDLAARGYDNIFSGEAADAKRVLGGSETRLGGLRSDIGAINDSCYEWLYRSQSSLG